jgi:DNA-binding transcriptional MerR regulator
LTPPAVTTAAIPNRPVFRAQEVCEIAQVQPYVLRSWEAEFPDLGTSKRVGDVRMYRRADVERVLRLKHLLFVDGLTLAGARRRLGEERGIVATESSDDERVTDADVAAMMDQQTRQSLREVRRGLQWILGVLAGGGITPEDRVLVAEPPRLRPMSSVRARSATRSLARKATRVVKRSAKGRSKR